MAALRILTATHRRWLLLLFACAMLVRALIPTGWMPITDAQGFHIVLCSGTGPAMLSTGPSAKAPMNHAMAGMHHEKSSDHHSQGPEHPCAFAGVTPAIDAPTLAAPLPLVRIRATPALARALVTIGHGLAAPPPPQTGPPTFA
ncbi:hypothetical protein EQZ23_08545 [Sphingomonas sp. UV9]|uniref:DUF2946 family protein n=1 Tax=Sphingomonas sp. UV9 TaxID=1851410 RepID=UPI000FFB70CD|nr:DUF2946 family protein [Sphingomonas sp. UV9]RXD05153.1 hypothetical protein EQZ23_08545 [Sphingomonas sp. UV9]